MMNYCIQQKVFLYRHVSFRCTATSSLLFFSNFLVFLSSRSFPTKRRITQITNEFSDWSVFLRTSAIPEILPKSICYSSRVTNAIFYLQRIIFMASVYSKCILYTSLVLSSHLLVKYDLLIRWHVLLELWSIDSCLTQFFRLQIQFRVSLKSLETSNKLMKTENNYVYLWNSL